MLAERKYWCPAISPVAVNVKCRNAVPLLSHDSCVDWLVPSNVPLNVIWPASPKGGCALATRTLPSSAVGVAAVSFPQATTSTPARPMANSLWDRGIGSRLLLPRETSIAMESAYGTGFGPPEAAAKPP